MKVNTEATPGGPKFVFLSQSLNSMIAFITKNEWNSPISLILLSRQKRKFMRLAKSYRGFRGVKCRWTWQGVYFMSLWKTDDQLNAFLNHPLVQESIDLRASKLKVSAIRMSAINFIPWREVYALMMRNSKVINRATGLDLK